MVSVNERNGIAEEERGMKKGEKEVREGDMAGNGKGETETRKASVGLKNIVELRR